MWRCAAGLVRGFGVRRFSDGTRRRIEDEGDWFYASEWWGNDHDSDAHTVFRSISEKGNGVVSVLTYPSSRPVSLSLALPNYAICLNLRYSCLSIGSFLFWFHLRLLSKSFNSLTFRLIVVSELFLSFAEWASLARNWTVASAKICRGMLWLQE